MRSETGACFFVGYLCYLCIIEPVVFAFIDYSNLLSYIRRKQEDITMAQATFSVRMDESLKKQFDNLCQEFGMNTSTAINIFARAVVRQRRIPFEIASPEIDITRESAMQTLAALRMQAYYNGIADMSLEEINREIALAREEMK